MIDRAKITQDWINEVSSRNRNVDKILVEKTIRALLLLEGLVKAGLSFVFKGGTAIMLHMQSARRLSIDIDIILPEVPDRLNEILDEVVTQQGFIRKALQPRISSSGIKKEHFKFFYTPIHKSNQDEESVLLDILYEKVNYSNIIKLPVRTTFLPVDTEPLFVDVPSLEDILGDKLTAFAPNTTGIPYFKNEDSMSMEIIKQLYDIGNLVDWAKDFKIVKSTFSKFVQTELTYRQEHSFTQKDVLEDIFQTALCIVTRGTEGIGDFTQLQFGIQRVSGFIISEGYHIEKAITHASKAAWLAILIKYDVDRFEKYENPDQVREWTLPTTVNRRISRLKKTNPEAFYYWYKISETRKYSNLENRDTISR